MLYLIPELQAVVAALPAEQPVYLVGGAVRDLLRGHSDLHDLDLVMPGDVLPLARRAANQAGAAYYPLDEARQTARLVFIPADGPRLVLDIAALRGATLEEDLRLRDFTINAMALDLHAPDQVIDPLGGAADLLNKVIRPCTPDAFTDDPIRVLRAVRQAVNFKFRLAPQAIELMRQAAPRLLQPSPERVRDELMRILGGPSPAAALRILDHVGALGVLLPELSALKGVQQSPPHTLDVWEHTLAVISRLEEVLAAFQPQYDPDQANNLLLGLAVLQLGRYRQQISEHLSTHINLDRPLRPILFLAALYHDVAKPATQSREPGGRIRFLEHDARGAQMASQRGSSLRLNADEITHLKKIVRYHMRPFLLGHGDQMPTRRAIFRFFRETGAAGVDICLHSLADMLATQGAGLPQQQWSHHLEVVRVLLEAWWERKEEVVAPPALVSGSDLMQRFGLPPGRQIGELLEAVREAQAEGSVTSVDEAYALVAQFLSDLNHTASRP
ncbi:MAG: HDIG domain-containing protein [Anaerolineales bacterium]|nr:HDIG domain-containing protein [Anaerolineales bacterium]